MMQLHVSRLNMSLVDQELSAIEYIPAMQRRRLSRLAKLALNSAMQTLDTHNVDYIVWVSQYGDEAKTLNILEDVLSEQTPSPTQFSTSVHNAISGNIGRTTLKVIQLLTFCCSRPFRKDQQGRCMILL